MFEPTTAEIDEVLIYLGELLRDSKLNRRRQNLIKQEIDDLLDDRLNASRPS
jgi:hypothetical protein